MFIYNVTTKVDHAIANAWLQWVKEEFIPAMIGTGCFTHAVVSHLVEMDDEEGLTYAVQYHAADKAQYDKYKNKFDNQLQKTAMDKWGTKYISFGTLMKVVN